MIHCAAYTTAETPSVKQWAGQPQKIATFRWESGPNTWFLGP